MYLPAVQDMLREDVFRWLDERLARGFGEFTRQELLSYEFAGTRIPLLDQGRGIRNPADLDATLSVMTSVKGPYADTFDADGIVRYSFQRDSVFTGDNAKMHRAIETKVPIVYFQGIRSGVYVAFYPAYVLAADIENREFLIGLDPSMQFFADPMKLTPVEKSYAERITRQRLHQPAFRARVMHAYERACTVCRLKHANLLDAAHIIGDSDADGIAAVSNGLALCKLHHAAYDRNLLGIDPDYTVIINRDLLDEVDGPMLRHGLQEMHGTTITLPRRSADRPERDRLAQRYEQFVA